MTPSDILAVLVVLVCVAAGLRAPSAHRARPGAGMTLVSRALWLAFGGIVALGAIAGAGAGESGLLASADPASLVMAALVAGVAAIVATFSRRHMQADPRRAAFARRLGLLSATALTIAFAQDVVALMAAWVLSGLILASLIGHVDGWADAQAAARKAREAFALGDAAMAAGLFALAVASGDARIGAILAHVSSGDANSLVVSAAALLILGGAASRAALPPLHGWLLSSVAAPTPVSAMMHAGMVNAGGFVLIKLTPLLAAAPVASTAAAVLGAGGAALGSAIMLSRSDVKGSLAASTVAQMGFMIMQIGIGAYAHALLHIVAHGLFKACLFLGAAGTSGVKAARPVDSRAPLAVAAVGAAVMLALAPETGAAGALALFAMATAAQSAAAALGARPDARRVALTAGVVVGAALLYVAGIFAADAVLGHGASAPSGALGWTVALALLALWAAAVLRGVPPALRVALMSGVAPGRAA